MKTILTITFCVVLSGCMFRVDGSEVRAAEYVCKSNGGIERIRWDGVFCGNGRFFVMSAAKKRFQEEYQNENPSH